MRQYENSTICDGCGLEFHWPPQVSIDKKFCCADCLEGFICNCCDLNLTDNRYYYFPSEEVSKYEGY